MREMKDSGLGYLGEIPAHWNTERIKNHLRFSPDKNPGDAMILSLYREHGIVPKDSRDDNHNVTSEDTSNYRYVRVGDFVVNKMKAWQGSMGVSDYEGVVSPAYYVYRFTTDAFDKIYLHYLLRSKCYADEFRRLSGGIRIGQWDLPKVGFETTYLAVPPKEEQTAIAVTIDAQLNKVDALIANVQTQVEKLKTYRQTVITETVTKGLDTMVEMRDSGIQWIGSIPAHWGTPKVAMLATVSSGATPDRTYPEYWNGTISWLKTGELQNNEIYESEEYITEEGLKNSSGQLYEPNTVLVAMYGQGKTRGMTALLRIQSTTNQACAGIVVTSKLISCEFLWKSLIGAYNGLRDLAVGSGQPNLNQALIRDFRIPLPPIQEQKEICDFLSKRIPLIDRLIAIKQSKIEKLEQYKRSLIYEYVTGKKEV